MEPQENKQIALQKATAAHEQAANALTDLMQGTAEGRYSAMLDRINHNLAELQREAAQSEPEDSV